MNVLSGMYDLVINIRRCTRKDIYRLDSSLSAHNVTNKYYQGEEK